MRGLAAPSTCEFKEVCHALSAPDVNTASKKCYVWCTSSFAVRVVGTRSKLKPNRIRKIPSPRNRDDGALKDNDPGEIHFTIPKRFENRIRGSSEH